jgi:hypothetical protein
MGVNHTPPNFIDYDLYKCSLFSAGQKAHYFKRSPKKECCIFALCLISVLAWLRVDGYILYLDNLLLFWIKESNYDSTSVSSKYAEGADFR